jgi:hypothetical protein
MEKTTWKNKVYTRKMNIKMHIRVVSAFFLFFKLYWDCTCILYIILWRNAWKWNRGLISYATDTSAWKRNRGVISYATETSVSIVTTRQTVVLVTTTNRFARQPNHSIRCSLFSSRRTVLRGWLTELTDRCRESKESSGVQSSAWSQEDRSEDSSARKGSTECRTQKIESLVYVL